MDGWLNLHILQECNSCLRLCANVENELLQNVDNDITNKANTRQLRKNLNILYDFAIKKGLTRVEASKIINEIVGKKFKKIKSVVQGGKVNPK